MDTEGGAEESKENILGYLQWVGRGLQGLLKGERIPLVLAGVEYLLALYRKANTYPHLVDQAVTGNPEELRAEALYQRAWAIAKPYFIQAQQDAAAQYKRYSHTEGMAHFASNDLNEVVPAAYAGRVACLFVAQTPQQWGVFDPDTLMVFVHQQKQPDDEDLLDDAALHTLLNGGTVYVVELEHVPDGKPLAAVFRH